MIIAYFISSQNKKNSGIGGHYYSLIATANAMSKTNEVFVVHIGVIDSLALENSDLKVYSYKTNSPLSIKTYFSVLKLIKELKPDVLHSFDSRAYFWVRLLSKKTKIPSILTRCGGKVPLDYFPYAPQLVLYSKENLHYFRSKKKLKETDIYFIPNRVFSFLTNQDKINNIKQLYGLNAYEFVFLRITRIGKTYSSSTHQLINLVKQLRVDGHNVCLLLVGKVEDVSIKNYLVAIADNVIIIDNPFYTVNAKEIIEVADIVLGTGRGFMEAASKGSVMLAPCKNRKYPIVVNNNNFERIFHYNFSERYDEKALTNEKIYEEIQELLKSKKKRDAHRLFIKKKYETSFNLMAAIPTYNQIYRKSRCCRDKNYIDLLLHLYYTLITFKSHYRIVVLFDKLLRKALRFIKV